MIATLMYASFSVEISGSFFLEASIKISPIVKVDKNATKNGKRLSPSNSEIVRGSKNANEKGTNTLPFVAKM
ncbi:MAG: hypothetical protein QW672_00080 [Archaeoglobaceae archaeon]